MKPSHTYRQWQGILLTALATLSLLLTGCGNDSTSPTAASPEEEATTLDLTLVDAGGESLEAALRVGAAIEEIDILDLQLHLAQTENSEIIMVYENLMKGSRNHLRSFTSTLARQAGQVYEPQYLDSDAHQAIVASPTERGGQG